MEDKKMKWWPHGNEFSPMDELVSRAVNRIEDKMQNGVKMTGISTGYYDLDYILSGLQKSELIVIASRPIMGKSALAMNIALNVARNEEGYVLYFNMDKPENLMVDRMLSMDSMVDSSSIRLGTLSDSDLKKVKASADVIGKSKMVIDDTTPMTISELCDRCRRFKIEHSIQLIIVDYLQGIRKPQQMETRETETAEVIYELKQIACELNVPVVLLSGLSHSVDQKRNHRPTLSDFGDLENYLQEIDVVMFPYRDEYYNSDSEDKGIFEVNVAKQKNGPTGMVRLGWLKEYTKIINLRG